MEKVIGLQIAGCAEVGFDALMSINWPGKKLDDFMPREEYYVNPVVYFATIDSEYQTYEAVICRFEGIDLRRSALQVAVRFPVGYGIADRKGNEISPAALVRAVLRKVIDENLKSFEGTYEYRGRQIPVFNVAEFEALLNSCSLVAKWGPMVDMSGTKTVYINGADDDDIDRKILQLPYIYRLSQASKVEIGEFSSAVTTTALSDDELNTGAVVRMHIHTRSGSVDNLTMDSNSLLVKASDFGYSTDVYKDISFRISREDVLGSFRNSYLTVTEEGFEVQLLPQKGVVDVRFNPPLRQKGYKIDFKGSGVAGNESELFDQLRYNGVQVNRRMLVFEGEQISLFESMPNDLLRDYFTLPNHARFKIENVRRDGGDIFIAVKKKAEPKPDKDMPKSAFKAEYAREDCRCMLSIYFGKEVELPANFDLVVTQRIERVVCTTSFPVDKPSPTPDGLHVKAQFVRLDPNVSIEVRVCRPTLYKGFAKPSGEENTFEVRMNGHKGTLARFMSIFNWQPVDGMWPVWRDVTVAVCALILCILCYFAGVFTSGFGVLADIRDKFVEPEPPATVVIPVERYDPKPEHETVPTPVDTVKTDEKKDSVKTDSTSAPIPKDAKI